MSRFVHFLGAILVSAVLVGWASQAQAASRLVLQVRSDLVPNKDFTHVTVRVIGEDACGNRETVSSVPASRHRSWDRGVRVAEIGNLKEGRVQAVVAAYKGEQEVVRRPVRIKIDGSKVRVSTVLLTADTCGKREARDRTKCSNAYKQCLGRPGKGGSKACLAVKRSCDEEAQRQRQRCERPPVLSGQHDTLLLKLKTGDDDLRGGRDNVNVTVFFKDGSKRAVINANQSRRWGDRCVNYVKVFLGKKVPLHQIKSIVLTTTGRGGFGGDDWNLNSIRVLDENASRSLRYRSGRPRLHRFTSKSRSYTLTL